MESLIPIVPAIIRSCTQGCEPEPWKPRWITAEPQIAARDLMVKHFTKILLCVLWNNRDLMNYWNQQMFPLIQIKDWSGKQLISRTNFQTQQNLWATMINPSKWKNPIFKNNFSWQDSKLFQMRDITVEHHVNVAKWVLRELCMSWKWKWGMVLVVLRKHRHMYVWTFLPQLIAQHLSRQICPCISFIKLWKDNGFSRL